MSQIDFAQVLIESFDQSASAINVQGNFSVSSVGITGWTVANPIGVSGSSLTATIANQLAISSMPSVGVSGTVSVSGSAITSSIAGTANVQVVGQPISSAITNFPATQGISGSVSSVLINSSGSAITVKTLSNQVASADFGLVTNSVIHGLTTVGGGTYVDVKVNPSGALAVDASNSSIAVTSMPAIAVSGTSAISGSISATVTNTVAISGSSITALTNQYTVLGYAGSAVLIPPSAINSSTGTIQSIGTIPANVKAVRIADTVGSFLAIYISSTASPAFVVEPGMADQLPYLNSASAAVSARFLENVSPTAGYTLLEWLG